MKKRLKKINLYLEEPFFKRLSDGADEREIEIGSYLILLAKAGYFQEHPIPPQSKPQTLDSKTDESP
jgi:hypothetical protein